MRFEITRYENGQVMVQDKQINRNYYGSLCEKGKAVASNWLDCKMIAKALREEKGE
jgi:hypothetical protein